MPGPPTKSRFGSALAGVQLTPPAAGLTFAPPDALAAFTPGCDGPSAYVTAAVRALALDFIFLAASAPWAADVASGRGEAAVAWVVDGPLWPVLTSAAGSVPEALAATVKHPSSLSAELDREVSRAASLIRAGLGLRVDAVVIAEDLAGRDGLLFTPGFAREEVLPRLATLVAAAEDVPVLLHSDGDIGAILPLLRLAGFAGVHGGGGVDRDGFERLFWQTRREDLVMIGGISTSALDRGVNAAVRAGTQAALLAQAGGLLIADDGGITTAQQLSAFGAALGAARANVVRHVGER